MNIDLRLDYPCPCRRNARLIPISLTDALGCNLCPNVYVVTVEGNQVEQISGLPTVKRRWRWTGNAWVSVELEQHWARWLLLGAMILLLGVGVWIVVHVLSAQWAILFCVLMVLLVPYLIERISRWFLRR